MSDENEKKWFDKKISRRDFLKKAGMVGAGAAIGASGAGAIFANMFSGKANQVVGNEEISFYGEHQSGIATLVQKNVYFAVLDLHSTDREEIKQMFKDWTDYSEKLMKGELVAPELANHLVPPIDTGETVGLNPYRLTITFGISPSFLDKLKLDNKKMEEFKDLPHFPRDQIKDKYKGGDICIQACADDAHVLHTSLPLGVIFELPVIVAFLTSLHILTPQYLIKNRRYGYFILLVVAVVLTPADFISDLTMAAPLILLYEVSISICKYVYKKRRDD